MKTSLSCAAIGAVVALTLTACGADEPTRTTAVGASVAHPDGLVVGDLVSGTKAVAAVVASRTAQKVAADEAARGAAEQAAAAEAAAARADAEAEAARVAAEQAAQQPTPARPAPAPAPLPRPAPAPAPAPLPRPAPAPKPVPAPVPAPAPAPGPVGMMIDLVNRSCHFDGDRYYPDFTTVYSDGSTDRTNGYNSSGPAIYQLWYDHDYGGRSEFRVAAGANFYGVGNC